MLEQKTCTNLKKKVVLKFLHKTFTQYFYTRNSNELKKKHSFKFLAQRTFRRRNLQKKSSFISEKSKSCIQKHRTSLLYSFKFLIQAFNASLSFNFARNHIEKRLSFPGLCLETLLQQIYLISIISFF